MKSKTIGVQVIISISLFMMLVSCQRQKAEWKGTIEEEYGVPGVTELTTPEELYNILKGRPQYQTTPYPESVEQEYEVAYPPTKEEAEERKQLSSGGKTPPVSPPASTGYRPPTKEEAAANAAAQAAKEEANKRNSIYYNFR